MKKILIILLSSIMLFSGCRKDNIDIVSEEETVSSDTHDEPTDYVWLMADVIPVEFNGNSITVDGEGAIVDGSIITITTSGTYSFNGVLDDGQLIVDTEDDEIVRLIFDGVDLNCSNNPPVVIISSDKTIIVLNEGTTNNLTDGQDYTSAEDYNAAIYSADDLTFFGDGELIVNANNNDGITSKDGLIIASGNINVNASDDGIIGKDYLIVKEGDIKIVSGGDGLKSNNDENTSLGYITIQDGNYDLKTGSDAIQAETNVQILNGDLEMVCSGGSFSSVGSRGSAKGIKAGIDILIEAGSINIDAADDGLNCGRNIQIDSGYLQISSGDDGIKADESFTIVNGIIDITNAKEGIESANVIIEGGDVSVAAADDGINTTFGVDGEQNDGSLLSITSGYVFITSSDGDAIDSNGDIIVTGGSIVVHGSSSQGGFDVNGTALISGGFAVISGTNNHMTEGFSPDSDQYSILMMSNTSMGANSIISIVDEDGNELVTFAPSNAYKSVVFSSEVLNENTTYSIYLYGAYDGGTIKDGLYQNGSYIPGDLKKTFTITSKYTEIEF